MISKRILLFYFIILACFMCSNEVKAGYYVSNDDPIKAKIYTLRNGLKIYMSVNNETPRISASIVIRTGSKNDPENITGLAHYLEHLMFKGTKHIGSINYEKERPLLDEIETLFETYRHATNEIDKKNIYHRIDSISYEASKWAISNEYDKLMNVIGDKGSNAFTDHDETVFLNDIPSNQLDNWIQIQADRFQNPVIRGFHTELETVYEEMNMSFDNDNLSIYNCILAELFPDYPYGKRTVLGSQKDLKSPSIRSIKEFYTKWYVPNNMAICLSGDFDTEDVIKLVEKYFGNMTPNPNLTMSVAAFQNPIKQPIFKNIYSPNAESVTLAWRLPGAHLMDKEFLDLVKLILNNGKVGLLDIAINQKQKILSSYADTFGLSDYDVFVISGRPKENQDVEEVRASLYNAIEKLRTGDFEEELIKASINNYRLTYMLNTEKNSERNDLFISSFIRNIPWEYEIKWLDRMSKVTKNKIVKFANDYLSDNSLTVYKRIGHNEEHDILQKPLITPIVMNRDSSSLFFRTINKKIIEPIEPVFLDYEKEIQTFYSKSEVPILCHKNSLNNYFKLLFTYEVGTNENNYLGIAFEYFKYIGTSKKSREEINKEFYKLACSYNVEIGNDRSFIILEGLSENMGKAMSLLDEILNDIQVNSNVYIPLISDILKKRSNAKISQSQIFHRLCQYGIWGEKSPFTNLVPSDTLASIDPHLFINQIHNINSIKHRILYYGPEEYLKVVSIINEYHHVPTKLKEDPLSYNNFRPHTILENVTYVTDFDSNQIYFSTIFNNGETFEVDNYPLFNLYNEYFGLGMNSILFQEMRESRGLAYSANAYFIHPTNLKYPYYFQSYIVTQKDKIEDVVNTFDDIINNFPKSENTFNLAKNTIINRLRSERITKVDVLLDYIKAIDLGINFDKRRLLFEKTKMLTLKDLIQFHNQRLKDGHFIYCFMGDENIINRQLTNRTPSLKRLNKENIFGY